MKRAILPIVCACAFAIIPETGRSAQAPLVKLPQASPGCTLTQTVGLTTIEIKYSRPGVKGRQVFGDLEPYGVVWRTGANSATKITFSTPLKFGGTDVPAGTYALFSIPDPKEWTVILNKVPGQWGSYRYDEKNDLVRVKVRPLRLPEPVETFTIDVNDIRDGSATLNLIWQNTRVPVKLETTAVADLSAKIEAAFAGDVKPTTGDYAGAAIFYLENNLDLQKAAQWIDAAIAQQPKAFYLYYYKARILAKQGDKANAKAAALRSIELAGAEGEVAKDEYTRLNQKVIAGLGE